MGIDGNATGEVTKSSFFHEPEPVEEARQSIMSLKKIKEVQNEVKNTASYKFAGQSDETRFNNLFQDRLKCKHPHGYIQTVTEKDCYYPGETVHGAVYF